MSEAFVFAKKRLAKISKTTGSMEKLISSMLGSLEGLAHRKVNSDTSVLLSPKRCGTAQAASCPPE